MFAQLFFLILNLLLISSAIEQTSSPFLEGQPEFAFAIFCISYVILLPILYQESRKLYKKLKYTQERIMFLANLELLLFFGVFYFFFGINTWFMNHLQPFDTTCFSLFSLFLYFTALFTCRYAMEPWKRTVRSEAWRSIAFLLPFTAPFLLFTFLHDISSLLPLREWLTTFGIAEDSPWTVLLFFLLNIGAIIAIVLLLPTLIVWIWQCPKLKDQELKKELDEVCSRAHFRHAGLRVWNLMNDSMTAAIVGITGKFRYVLFSQKLIDHIPARSIAAILAHEIGHSVHYHLIIYPVIFLGMMISGYLVPALIYQFILPPSALEDLFSSFLPFFLFCMFCLTITVYFRFVFGYFSRLFERQADLHIFALDIPAADMIEALDHLGTFSGNIHDEPNWHHYSIRQRIQLLQEANDNRLLIAKHTRLVRLSLALYFLALLCSFGALFLIN